MPTDFVAKWLSFLGRFALFFARLKEPKDQRERDFLLISLGVTSIVVGALALAGAVPMVSGLLKGLLDVQDSPEWFYRAAWAVQKVLTTLVFSPALVGMFYGSSFARIPRTGDRMWLGMKMSGVIVLCTVVVVYFDRDALLLRGLLDLSMIPIIISLCPVCPARPPGRRSGAATPTHRYKVRPRVVKAPVSA